MIKVFEEIIHLFGQLAAVKGIPQDISQHEDVINRAIDVRSAAMNYIAITIRHHSTPFGTIGIAQK